MNFQPPDVPDPFEGMESGDVLDHKRDHFANLLPKVLRDAFYSWLDDERLAAYADGRRDENKELTTCNCRWDGEKLVQQCTLHEAWKDAIHDWARRAKEAEHKLQTAPADALWKLLVDQANTRYVRGPGESDFDFLTGAIRGWAMKRPA